MTNAEVQEIMHSYLSDTRFEVSRDGALWGEGLYIASKSSGNHCDVSIKNGKVDKIDIHFE